MKELAHSFTVTSIDSIAEWPDFGKGCGIGWARHPPSATGGLEERFHATEDDRSRRKRQIFYRQLTARIALKASRSTGPDVSPRGFTLMRKVDQAAGWDIPPYR